MEKKLIIICATLLLIVSGTANAVLTYTDTSSMTLNTGWLDGPTTYSWTHSWTFTHTPTTITSATLDIMAWDVFQETIPITLDGVGLGNLTQASSTNSNVLTSLNLGDYTGALDELMDESAMVSLSIPSGKAIKVKTSLLTINYEYGEEEEPPPNGDEHPPGWIPAPGAILLGSIGVGLVGWLRRRKSL